MAETEFKAARSKKRTDTIYFPGKIPPSAADIEEIVLGALMLEKGSYHLVEPILDVETFYLSKNQLIYAAIQDLHKAHAPVDIATVCHQLKKNGHLDSIGGPFSITQLTNRVASAANIEYHSYIIKQKWIMREIINMNLTMANEAYEDTTDCFALLANNQRKIEALYSSLESSSVRSLSDMATEVKIEIIQRSSNKTLPGVSCGFPAIDEVTLGLMPSDLIVIAARPGVGKTSLVMNIAKRVASDKTKVVVVFSLEMKDTQLVYRIIAEELRLNSQSITRGSLLYDDMKRVEEHDMDYKNFIFDDTAAISIAQMQNRVTKIKMRLGQISLIVVDYLQLMKGDGDKKTTRDQDIGDITRGLKQIAKEFNTPVIALSQLSREVEKRTNKRPRLADLRESGSIEQDADSVWFILRPDYYKEEFAEDEQNKDIAKIMIAKNRHGGLKDVKLKFIPEFTRFESIEESTNPYNKKEDVDQF